MKTIKALIIAVMILTSLWAGIGIGITSADSEPAAEVRIIGENRIEIWKGGSGRDTNHPGECNQLGRLYYRERRVG